MNDTIINDRQKRILELLDGKIGLNRLELTKLISEDKPISRITVIRDLNELINLNLIKSEGLARFKKYYLSKVSPLLKYVDIDKYFNLGMGERNAKPNFNNDVFSDLNNLFTDKEKLFWNNTSNDYKNRIKNLDKSIYKRELERFIVEFSWKSAQIEGNTYDLLETETLFTQNIEAKGHPHEEAVMLLNHKNAFDTILENKESFKKLDFSDVIQLHGVLTKDLVSSGIRKQAVRISGTPYVPLISNIDLEKNLRKIIETINKTDFPPEKALISASMIAYLQPFADGNKRISRMLANAILLAYDYFPLSYRDVDVNDYRKALILFYEQNNLYYLKKIFNEQLTFALDNYFRID